MTTETTHDPADWSDLHKAEYSGRIIEAKIHGPVSNGDYMRQDVKRGDPAYVMSRSELKNFASNPARWIKGYREGETSEKRFGSLLDALVFSQEFAQRYVVAPKTYPAPESQKKGAAIIQKPWNRNAKYCQEWELSQCRQVITDDEANEALAARMALFADSDIRDYLDGAQFQVLVTGTYQDFATEIKVPLKGCVDIVPKDHDSLGDLKTTCSVSPGHSAKEADRFWYGAQGKLYLDLFAAAGDERQSFHHVMVENFPPFQIGRRYLSVETLRVGAEKYHGAMKLYCQCLKTGDWPSHEDLPTNAHLSVGGWLATEPYKP